MMKINNFTAGTISPREIIKQRECEYYLINKRAYLKENDSEKSYFYKKWLSDIKVKKLNTQNTNSVEVNLKEIFDNWFLKEWFSIPQAYETSYAKHFAMAERFIEYFNSRELEVIGVDGLCELFTGGQLKWQDVAFSRIADTCDFIVKDAKDGKVHVIKVVSSMPYSMRARSQVNKPVNSPELILMKAAFIEQYPDCVCELWSIKSSKDSGIKLAENFDFNVVSCDFDGFETKDALLLFLYDVMAMNVNHASCSECRYKAYCPKTLSTFHPECVEEEVKTSYVEPKFTEEQTELIEHVDGPLSVVAIPGAGKTASLVARCKRLIEKGIDARNILLVSFTKKACEELVARLKLALGTNDIPLVLTLNAFGNNILINNRGVIGRRFKLADDCDCMALIEELMPSQPSIEGASYEGAEGAYGIIPTLYRYFQEIDKNGKEWFLEKYPTKDTDNIFSFYDAFKAEYNKRGNISYEDQIGYALDLLRSNAKVAFMMSRLYRYIMVDEYQDVNEAQAELIDIIAQHHQNLVVVGDDDQSIYGWRGGSNKFLINFEDRYAGAKLLKFCDNFRSTDKILSACQTLINKNNGSRIEKTFVAHRNGTNAPCLFKNFTPEAVPGIVERANKAGFNNGDIAIICRKNKGVELVSAALNKSGVEVISPRDFLINDALYLAIRDVLSLMYTGIEDVPLYRLLRCLDVQPRSMVRIAKYKNSTLYDQLVSEGYMYSLSDETYENFEPMMPDPDSIIENLMYPVLNAGCKIYNAFKVSSSRKVTDTIPGIAKALFGEDAIKHPSLRALLEQADERGIADTVKLLEFMNHQLRFNSTNGVDYAKSESRVNVMTAHASKGKEFPFVLVFGVEEFEEDEESTRLLFVAMSRAKKSLFLAEGPAGYSKLVPQFQSNLMVKAY